MKTDYFSDLLPDTVTRVTQPEKQCVTPEPDSVTSENNDLSEASRVSRTSRTNNSDTDEAIAEHLAERAAIQEIDGGLDRATAEAEARRNLKIYRYRLAGVRNDLILIAPGTSLDEAEAGLRARFGKRLIDVVPHTPYTGSQK